MPRARRDTNKAIAKAVAKVTKTTLPKAEDLLGSAEARRHLAAAKKSLRSINR